MDETGLRCRFLMKCAPVYPVSAGATSYGPLSFGRYNQEAA
jgi:hypothetical protein